MPDVFPYPISGARRSLERDKTWIPAQPGYEWSVSHDINHTNSDGAGVVRAHKGRHQFQLDLPPARYTGTEFQAIWTWLVDHEDEEFYAYAYPEAAAVDLTGTETVGRYLVVLKSPLAASLEQLSFLQFSTLEFAQVF